jgi:undecaprenyl-diphosphatase
MLFMNTLEAANRALFLAINGTPSTSGWIAVVAHICAKDLIVLIPLLLIGLWLTGRERAREAALHASLITLLALGVNFGIGLAWRHPRPFMVGLGYLFLPHAPTASFPSDHATICAAAALTLLASGLRRSGGAALLAGLAVAWARVFVGVHFPLDMLGAAVACLVYAATAPLWQWRGRVVTQAAVVRYRQWFALPIRLDWLRG